MCDSIVPRDVAAARKRAEAGGRVPTGDVYGEPTGHARELSARLLR